VMVTGLGLIGLVAVQILKAHGCRVLGVDFDSSRCAVARQFGAETVDLSKGEDVLSAASDFSRARGVDAVLITASTQSDEPVHQAAVVCRKRGRIVLVGVVGLQLSRADFYEKELTFQVSCSYGPGRYDEAYEQKGQDYPIGFVRWTEQRNFEAVLDLMAERKVDVRPLITHRFPFARAIDAYNAISDKSALGIVLEYDAGTRVEVPERIVPMQRAATSAAPATGTPVIGVIGAGGFTGQVLLPALQKTGVRLKSIASAAGVTGTHLAGKFGFEASTTDAETIIEDPAIDTVVITTRHNTHARYVIAALRAGKRVYVEKPLCLNEAELGDITTAYSDAERAFLMVGFNRRFAPHVAKMKTVLDTVKQPKTMVMTVNAGAIPRNHWIQDPQIGGGRIIGEACHFIDLLRFIAGSAINDVQAFEAGANGASETHDTLTFTLKFADGSVGTVHYFANGNKAFPKERLEVFCAGRILQLDNFRKLNGYGWPGFKGMTLWRQDKGHGAEMQAFVAALQSGGPAPIAFDELVEVTRTSFDVVRRALAPVERQPVPVVAAVS
jgi:predicted dehydrogenase